MTEKTVEDLIPPDEFYKIINDFIADILITFPEYTGIISRWWNINPTSEIKENAELSSLKEKKEGFGVSEAKRSSLKEKETLLVFRHCIKVFPERFFDILYKNVEIFSSASDVSTEFLPGIVFSQLWNCDISDNTRETIWKYLQLILFSVIGTVHNSSELGDTAKLFEAINEDELKQKLEETLENMQNLFDTSGNDTDNGINMENIPNAQQLHEHLNSMMSGKIGKLALELAEETAKELNLDMENTGNAKDVFQRLFKNPGKMMKMVQNIGSKIDEKIKSGEIKESELMQEGMDLLNKMKDMPGMGDMQKMFSQMGIPGLGRGAKLNMGAMEAQLNRNMKTAKMKERMKTKVENKKNAFCNMSDEVNQTQVSEEEIMKIFNVGEKFSTGEKVEKTPRGAKPPQPNNNKKKKSKK
jgi:hypothetical protein